MQLICMLCYFLIKYELLDTVVLQLYIVERKYNYTQKFIYAYR